jgi:hypothetical protein
MGQNMQMCKSFFFSIDLKIYAQPRNFSLKGSSLSIDLKIYAQTRKWIRVSFFSIDLKIYAQTIVYIKGFQILAIFEKSYLLNRKLSRVMPPGVSKVIESSFV